MAIQISEKTKDNKHTLFVIILATIFLFLIIIMGLAMILKGYILKISQESITFPIFQVTLKNLENPLIQNLQLPPPIPLTHTPTSSISSE